MKVEIENTIKKINDLIDSATNGFLKADDIMKLSQSALNLAHTAAQLDVLIKKP